MPGQRRAPVLVVEDHAINRLLMQRVLELEGLEVLTADSLSEAQRIIARRSPPVVVLDVQLPDGNGLEFARRLKADPILAGCAIVACTAATMLDEEQQALQAGCAAFVSKPIDTRRFGQLVASLMTAQAADEDPLLTLPGPAHPHPERGAG